MVVYRDLLLAMRRRSDVANTVIFFVIVVSLFPFGVGPEPNLLRAVGPGVLWVAALLAALLALGMAAIPAARARYGDELPASIVAVAEYLQDHFDALMEARREAWRDSITLVHGDFHPGQIFYPSEQGGRFAVFDWQTVSAGGGVS